MMEEMGSQDWPGQALMLDGNAAAGVLFDVFNAEMTASPTECARLRARG